MNFVGDGYLELPRSLLPHFPEDESELIALVISTNKSDGLIFWHGQGKDIDGKGQDYISLAGKIFEIHKFIQYKPNYTINNN